LYGPRASAGQILYAPMISGRYPEWASRPWSKDGVC
jgi:hypothetical protein